MFTELLDIKSGNVDTTEDILLILKGLIEMQFNLFEEDCYENEDLGAGEGKVCSKCDTYLPLTSFGRHSGANFLRAECRDCNNKLYHIRTRLKKIHGMPQGKYVCPICNGDAKHVKGRGNTKNGSWVLDHCHDTDTFRGWLCHKCNRALGGMDDDVPTLKRAIQYVEDHLKRTFLV